jgi:hypothetical protein
MSNNFSLPRDFKPRSLPNTFSLPAPAPLAAPVAAPMAAPTPQSLTTTQEAVAGTLTGNELTRIVQSGLNAQVTLQKIAALAVSSTNQVNVMDFGAVGDGVTDDAPSINAAGAFAQANGRSSIIFPAGKTFYIKSSSIWVRSNIIWEGNGATLYTDQPYPALRFAIFGNQAHDTKVAVGELTADFVGPSDKVTLTSVAGLNVGDWVGVRLGEDPYQPNGSRFVTVAKVIAIVGTTVTIDRIIPLSIPITSSYIYVPVNGQPSINVSPTVSASPSFVGSRTVFKFPNNDIAVNVIIRNFNILGSTTVANAGAITIQWGYNVIIEDVTFNNDGVSRDGGIGYCYMQFCHNCRLVRPIFGWHANIGGGSGSGGGFSFPECYSIKVEDHITRNVHNNICHTESWSFDILISGGMDIVDMATSSSSFFAYGLVASHVTLHNMTLITNSPATNFSEYISDIDADSFIKITGVFTWRGPMANAIVANREEMDCLFDYEAPGDGAVRVDFQSKNRQSVKIPLSPNMSNAVFQLDPAPIMQLDLYTSQNTDPATVTNLLIDGDNTYSSMLQAGQIVNVSGLNLKSSNAIIGQAGRGIAALTGLQNTAGQVRISTSAAAQAPGNFITVSTLNARVLETGQTNIFANAGATPTSIFGSSNIVAWYKADTGVTGTNPITAWADQSGNGHTLSVAFGAPSFASGGFKGFPAVVMARADGLNSAIFNVGLNISAFFIVANIDTNGANSATRIISYFEQFSTNDFDQPFAIEPIGVQYQGAIVAYQNSVNTYVPTNNTLPVPAFSNARIASIYNGPAGTFTQILNNITTRLTSGFGNNTLGSANTRLTVGYNFVGGIAAAAPMKIAEILWIKTIPTQQNLNDLDYYFSTKYGGLLNNSLGNNLIYSLSDMGADDLFSTQRIPFTGGTFVANGATPVTVNNANVAITDVIIFSLNTVGGTVGALPTVKTITAATGFTVAATAGDTSTYNYVLIKNV